MRISDWSSDVCSSDLAGEVEGAQGACVVFRQHATALHAGHHGEPEIGQCTDLVRRMTRAAAVPDERALRLAQNFGERIERGGVRRADQQRYRRDAGW